MVCTTTVPAPSGDEARKPSRGPAIAISFDRVAVEAVGGAYGSGGWFHRDDFPKMASTEAAAEMWSRTDLRPSDVNVAEIYDGFTFLTFAWLEALGFCADGEAGPLA